MLREKMITALEFVKDLKGVRTQKEFALAVGMPSDRLRNIANGKIQKLQPDEALAIQRAFGIRSAWWFSDAAPMRLTEDEQAIQPLLNELGNASAEILALGLNGPHASFVQELLFNVRTKNTKALGEQLEAALPVGKARASMPRENGELQQLWALCKESDRAALMTLLRSLAFTEEPPPLSPDGRYPQRVDAPPATLHDKPRKKGV
jgi:plasmid maintenance system antidote protein VapI